MPFANEKKTFLAKLDKSRKGEVDQRIIPLLNAINNLSEYYTTSSCSGRVYIYKSSGKKNETQWINVSHELIPVDFLTISENGLLWLRLEGMILHIACKDILAANALLEPVRRIYKKSCILSASNKVIIEVRGSELLEMPLYQEGKLLFNGDLQWLQEWINVKLQKIWDGSEKLEKIIEKI